jgi:hypothetical protein
LKEVYMTEEKQEEKKPSISVRVQVPALGVSGKSDKSGGKK